MSPYAHFVYVWVVGGSVAALDPVALIRLPEVQVLAAVEPVDFAQVVRVQLPGVHRVQGQRVGVVFLQFYNIFSLVSFTYWCSIEKACGF